MSRNTTSCLPHLPWFGLLSPRKEEVAEPRVLLPGDFYWLSHAPESRRLQLQQASGASSQRVTTSGTKTALCDLQTKAAKHVSSCSPPFPLRWTPLHGTTAHVAPAPNSHRPAPRAGGCYRPLRKVLQHKQKQKDGPALITTVVKMLFRFLRALSMSWLGLIQ